MPTSSTALTERYLRSSMQNPGAVTGFCLRSDVMCRRGAPALQDATRQTVFPPARRWRRISSASGCTILSMRAPLSFASSSSASALNARKSLPIALLYTTAAIAICNAVLFGSGMRRIKTAKSRLGADLFGVFPRMWFADDKSFLRPALFRRPHFIGHSCRARTKNHCLSRAVMIYFLLLTIKSVHFVKRHKRRTNELHNREVGKEPRQVHL